MFKSKSNSRIALMGSVFVVALFLTGCAEEGRNIDFLKKWQTVSIGNTRESVVAVLGKPIKEEVTEYPLYSSQKLTWIKGSSAYVIKVVWGRVYGKNIELSGLESECVANQSKHNCL